jgi:hypothetical protein
VCVCLVRVCVSASKICGIVYAVSVCVFVGVRMGWGGGWVVR